VIAGSEWRLHRQWFEHSAMADLLGEDYALAERNALYRCLDKLLPSRQPRQQLRHDPRRPLADAARVADAARAEPGRDKPVGCERRLPLALR
jgi:hypothetical protein